jgi:XTP/dITP diphosphohydrolase
VRRLLVASGNAKKLRELRELCAGLPLEVVGPEALPGGLPEVVEDGADFAANAAKKALAAARAAAAAGAPATWALADDSGLCVDALQGAPGVRSARFAGAVGAAQDAANNALLLARLRSVPPAGRGAEFRCVLVVADAQRPLLEVAGAVRGRILDAPDGAGGFGYDPLFYHVESGTSFARLSAAAKAAVSHRGQAMTALRARLIPLLTCASA